MSAISIEQMNTLPGWNIRLLKNRRAPTYTLVALGNLRLTFWQKHGEINDLVLEGFH
jgi:hypothetical protein